MNDFDHEKLDVYQAAIDFAAMSDDIVGRLPRGEFCLRKRRQGSIELRNARPRSVRRFWMFVGDLSWRTTQVGARRAAPLLASCCFVSWLC